MRQTGPGVLDALALLADVADELVVRSVRETHLAVADRAHGATRVLGPTGRVAEVAHRGIAGAVYAGIGASLRTVGRGLDRAAASGAGPRLDATAPGRFLASAVNGLIGDRLQTERPHLAIPMAVRRDGRDVTLDRGGLGTAYPDATGRVAVFLHGLCESESIWDHRRDRVGTTYPEALADRGWTPVLLRANTGLSLRENGVVAAALLRDLVAAWPVPVTRLVLVGHSMGGLVLRAATASAEPAAASPEARPWTELVTDVVTLGTPHLGAPLARGVGHGSRGLAMTRETAAFGRILDWRSTGVLDLVTGLTEDVPPLPHASYRLVAGTLTRSERHPVGHLAGDMLVRVPSAHGRDRRGERLFPGGTVLHVGRAGHFALANHPDVHRAMAEWLR